MQVSPIAGSVFRRCVPGGGRDKEAMRQRNSMRMAIWPAMLAAIPVMCFGMESLQQQPADTAEPQAPQSQVAPAADGAAKPAAIADAAVQQALASPEGGDASKLAPPAGA